MNDNFYIKFIDGIYLLSCSGEENRVFVVMAIEQAKETYPDEFNQLLSREEDLVFTGYVESGIPYVTQIYGKHKGERIYMSSNGVKAYSAKIGFESDPADE